MEWTSVNFGLALIANIIIFYRLGYVRGQMKRDQKDHEQIMRLMHHCQQLDSALAVSEAHLAHWKAQQP